MTSSPRSRSHFSPSLGPGDRAAFSACSSSDDLIKSLRNLEHHAKSIQKRSLTRCHAVFQKLNNKLQPYFDALNVLASADTTSALVYGALRVLASAFPTFFEKLVKVLDRLGKAFPQYDAIVKLFDGQPPPRMRRHLESVYQDLFSFLQIAARIFTASNGKVKRPLGMISSVIWRPFEERFGDLLSRMDEHQRFIMDELEILQAERAKDVEKAASIERSRAEHERQKAIADREKTDRLESLTADMKRMMEKQARDLARTRLLEWLAPPSFADALESIEREEGTAQWIFDDQTYKDWVNTQPMPQEHRRLNHMPPWVLWVHGNPGCGKTVLASSVVEKSNDDNKDSEPVTTCHFFFKYNDPKSSTIEAAYQSILAQILHQNRHDVDLLDKFIFFGSYDLTPSASGQQTATLKELADLVRLCANGLGHVTLVLDAIDESNEPDLVAHKLKDLAATAPIKLICFSRPSVNALQTLVPLTRQIKFDRNLIKSDIKIFLLRSLQEMVGENKLAQSADEIDVLADILVYGADGMFLWAKLMVKYLNSPALTPTSRLRTIHGVRFPEGLDAMYNRIALLISQLHTAEKELARRVLIWLHYTDYEGHSFTVVQGAVADADDPPVQKNFVSLAISVCGGLVEFNTSTSLFTYTHLTVSEYLTSQPWKCADVAASLVPGPATAAIEIATRCLCRVVSHAPTEIPSRIKRRQHIATFEGGGGSFCEVVRFVRRAALGRTGNQDLDSVQRLAPKLLDLTNEIRQIDSEWSTKLGRSPGLIWDDVLAFRQGGILSKLADFAPTTAVALAPDAPKLEDGTEIPCLCKVSTTSVDGKVMGVLSIYPCPGFARFWRTLDITTAYYQDAEKFSAGWIARYEVWSVDSTTRMAGCDVSLSASEILLLLRHLGEPSANEDSEGGDEKLEISFPTSIGHDCQNERILTSFVLPLQSLTVSGSKWTSQLGTFDPGEFAHFPDTFRAAWRDWYTYSLSFSPDGRYICFADYQKPCITQLAVFELGRGTRFEAELIRSTMARLGPPKVSDLKFHPRLPVLAFLSERRVWIWDFSGELESSSATRGTKAGELADSTVCTITSLTFSRCGGYLMAKNQNDVEVLRVPQEMMNHRPQNRIEESAPPHRTREATELVPVNNALAKLEKSRLRPGDVLSEAHFCPDTTLGSASSKNALFLSTADKEIRLGSAEGDSNATVGTHLISLPKSFSTKHTAVSLLVP
ncbi:hypothetical protein QBC34DRAFT_482279 [Podospora aff. communis PSN243]|uniref:NACHT domain-containing protein n=1 Tax=Podospora aff. communis PSN243 TaxID=3040156 RepID=A0AAV9H600_9PEZI|nr:hypothetical protein QBC34DRAFT_482279 [Podospora aff. communis PSN243]